MSADLQQQFIRDMLAESSEGLERFDQDLLALERGDRDPERLNGIFRVIHTLKGTAGCLGFKRIQDLSHVGETLLDLLRSHSLEPSPDRLTVLFELSDMLKAELVAIESTGAESSESHEALITRLENAGREDFSAQAAEPVVEETPEVVDHLDDGVAFGLFEEEDEPAPPAAEIAWGLFEDTPEEVPSTQAGITTEAFEAPNASREIPASTIGKVASSAPAPTPPSSSLNGAKSISSQTVRVDVTLLDQLMNLVGELVLARNQLGQATQAVELNEKAIQQVSQRLNLITSDLQEGVMKTRMQPIGNVWSKFPRIVRDISRNLGKKVRLETFGEETELDRTILEAISDPLTHIVRNSIDHGVEEPETRRRLGKSEEAQLIMRAFHEGGQVNLEIIDDGAGVNLAKVRSRALERGLLRPEEADQLSSRDLHQLVFAPGFSTAEKVTDVSGRGVGMDVVRTNIERIGGSVDLQSESGEGTTVKIRIPLTLAIIPALIVRAAERRFAIPQVDLVELVRLKGEGSEAGIEYVQGAAVFRLRGDLLPLVFLRRELKLAGEEPSKQTIVVLRTDDKPFGLVVDGVCDTEEIVVKPLSKQLKGISLFSGATIMGDGRVSLILDVSGLSQCARLSEETNSQLRLLEAHREENEDETLAGQRSQLLLFSLHGRPRLAVQLDQAARLEQFPASALERSGEAEAIQYRGGILPILRLANALPGSRRQAVAESAEDLLSVIVCRVEKRLVGVVVEEIQDIVEEEVRLDEGSASPGLLGSAIIQGRITDLVNLPSILAAFHRSTHRRVS